MRVKALKRFREAPAGWVAGFLALFLCAFAASAAAPKPGAYAVASAHPLATEAGLEVLAAGGNAFDAAVAVSAAVAVVEPTSSGLGGGGFWLLHRAVDGFETFVDGREVAPLAATPDMYLGPDRKPVREASTDGALAAAIPGEPATLEYLANTYGRLPLPRSLAPAIRYARQGFACDDKLADAFEDNWSRLSRATQAVFAVEGRAPRTGERIVQSDLAALLERIAREGSKAFYSGEYAKRLVEGVRAAGGIWSEDDLRRYQVIEREPMRFRFRDVRLVTAPPPSAGGVALAEILGQLELLGWKPGAPESEHLLIEAMRRAYRDRAAWLGDPAYVDMPIATLTSRPYLSELVNSVQPARATPSASLPPAPAIHEGTDTTHFSVLDAEGNRVAATLSINLPFGSGFMAPGTGVLLNDEMDDFAASLDTANAYGLVGSAANRVEPAKRPLSSMTPTFAEGPNGLLIIGTPGGSRIITMVLLGLLEWIDGKPASAVVATPRFHHQYLPDVVQIERAALSPEVRARLGAMGHTLKELHNDYGNMHVVTWNPARGTLDAASDPRGVGAARVAVVEPRALAAQRRESEDREPAAVP